MHKLCLYYGATVLTTHFTRSDASVVLRICKSFAIIHISPYSVYVVSEILCTVTGLFIYNTCRTSDGTAGACLKQGRVCGMMGHSDLDYCVTVGVMF